jgi:hypothetical protein
MVKSNQQTFDVACNCCGFTAVLAVQPCENDANTLDVLPVLQFHTDNQTTAVSGCRTFVSRSDIKRLVEYIHRTLATTTCSGGDAFVPLELGFEVTFEDFNIDSSAPDESEVTMSVWINVGYREGVGRSYAGARGIVSSSELTRFSLELQKIAERS